MVGHTPASTTAWVAERLKTHDEVAQVTVEGEQVVRIERKKYDPFNAGVVSARRVTAATIEPLSRAGLSVQFLANVPKEALWTGEAISSATSLGAAWGGLGDLFSAIADEQPSTHVNSEFGFAERGIRQHSAIEGFERLFDRKYLIRRHGKSRDVVIVLINEYDITADHIRTAWDRYGKFDWAVKTNPNGRVTQPAYVAASSMGTEIHDWRGFFARLNKP